MMLFRYSNICRDISSVLSIGISVRENVSDFSNSLLPSASKLLRFAGRGEKKIKGKGKEKEWKKEKKDNEDSRVGNKILTSSKELFPCVSWVTQGQLSDEFSI